MMKDESGSLWISEAVCLRAKMYSVSLTDGSLKQTLKGMKKHVTKREITLQDYLQVLNTSIPQQHSMNIIRSKSHQLYIQMIKKTSLSSFDDKRYAIDHVRTLPYNHYLTK